MSNAKPMSTNIRHAIYALRYVRGRWFVQPKLTQRQRRQLARMEAREELRAAGAKHGASGVKVRQPHTHKSRLPLRCSLFGPFVVEYCAPCPQHAPRPRLHRRLREDAA